VSNDDGPLGIIQNELAYITTAKRCSLWRFIPGEDRLGFILDLPSRGDTCFPSLLRGDDPDQIVIYDYSSDIEGPELPWSAGQRRETYVYRHELRFRRTEPPL
jgi:diadenosine tetraphosphatase ApaH/serine/threonine PP2A family protein phosphatase